MIPKDRIILVSSVILTLAFLFFGGMKFASPQQLLDNFANWGYPSGFHYLVGLAEVACALGLFLRPVAKWAALLLGIMMTGAFITHALNPPLSAGIPSLLLGGLAYFTAFRYFVVRPQAAR